MYRFLIWGVVAFGSTLGGLSGGCTLNTTPSEGFGSTGSQGSGYASMAMPYALEFLRSGPSGLSGALESMSLETCVRSLFLEKTGEVGGSQGSSVASLGPEVVPVFPP